MYEIINNLSAVTLLKADIERLKSQVGVTKTVDYVKLLTCLIFVMICKHPSILICKEGQHLQQVLSCQVQQSKYSC